MTIFDECKDDIKLVIFMVTIKDLFGSTTKYNIYAHKKQYISLCL